MPIPRPQLHPLAIASLALSVGSPILAVVLDPPSHSPLSALLILGLPVIALLSGILAIICILYSRPRHYGLFTAVLAILIASAWLATLLSHPRVKL